VIWPRLRVFISYAREDEKRADALYDSLVAAGFEPWMDRRKIPAAAEWQTEINRAIRRCHAFLACISSSSTQKSGVLASEIDSALQRWKSRWWWWKSLFLLPVRFEDCPPPAKLSQLQFVDVFQDKDWVRVANVLRRAQRNLIGASIAVLALLALGVVFLFSVSQSNLIARFRRPGGLARIGITVWKLDQVPAAPGSKTLLHESVCQSNEPRDWRPLRAGAGAQIHLGDRVRISIESGLEGYVYVVDREMNGSNRRGIPKLVFPTGRIRGGNNHISPGALIELPDQQDCPPYWTLSSGDPTYSGELVTVLIVEQLLKDVSLQQDAQLLSASVFDAWAKKWTAPLLTMDNRALLHAPATEPELAAGQSARTLTESDPFPQTVFAKKDARNNAAILVDFPIRVQ
jgi:hypothetical protein